LILGNTVRCVFPEGLLSFTEKPSEGNTDGLRERKIKKKRSWDTPSAK